MPIEGHKLLALPTRDAWETSNMELSQETS